MLKKRQILCIEAESEPSHPHPLPNIADLLGLPEQAPVLTDLTSTSQAGLAKLATDLDMQEKHGKAGKNKLKYLLLAFQKFPDMAPELKHQAAAVISNLEAYGIAAMKEQKLKVAGAVIKAVDKALEQGLKVAHKGKHQVKLLQLHAYFALYQGKLTNAIQYIEQAKLLESKHTHILQKCTSRLLEAYIYAAQLDHKIALRLLRESLTIQTRHKVPELINSSQELNWFFRLLIVTLYNLSVESFHLHLRQDALQFAEKAHQIVLENQDLAPSLTLRINRLYAALFPEEQGTEASPVPTEISEEAKLPFLPGGRTEEKPGKIVEMKREEERLPRVSPLAHAPKSYFPTQTPSKRYRSVPPSQRRKLLS